MRILSFLEMLFIIIIILLKFVCSVSVGHSVDVTCTVILRSTIGKTRLNCVSHKYISVDVTCTVILRSTIGETRLNCVSHKYISVDVKVSYDMIM